MMFVELSARSAASVPGKTKIVTVDRQHSLRPPSQETGDIYEYGPDYLAIDTYDVATQKPNYSSLSDNGVCSNKY